MPRPIWEDEEEQLGPLPNHQGLVGGRRREGGHAGGQLGEDRGEGKALVFGAQGLGVIELDNNWTILPPEPGCNLSLLPVRDGGGGGRRGRGGRGEEEDGEEEEEQGMEAGSG